jgi:hypothetical protein
MLYKLHCVIHHPETYVEIKDVRGAIEAMRDRRGGATRPLHGVAQRGIDTKNAQSVDYLKVLGGLFAFSPRAIAALGPRILEELVIRPISIRVGSSVLEFVAGLPARELDVVNEENSVFMRLGGVDILDRPSYREPDTQEFLIARDRKFEVVVVSHLFVETAKSHGLEIAFERVL